MNWSLLPVWTAGGVRSGRKSMAAKTNFRGSFTALVTPFKNGSLDEASFRGLVSWQIAEGTHGLVPVGSTGESPTVNHDEHAPPGLVDAPFDDALVLIVVHRRAFPGGADRHQAVGALGDLPAHQAPKGRFVERAVLERRDQSGEGAPEIRLGRHGFSPRTHAACRPNRQ